MRLIDCKNLKNSSGIYGILNTVTHKWYIGSTHDFNDRIRRHLYYLKLNSHHSQKLQRAWNKYGENVFDFFILEEVDSSNIEKLYDIEESYIKKFDSYHNGYNCTDICHECPKFTLSEEARNKFILTKIKSVIAINRFSGKVEKEFDSISNAAKYYNTSTTNISGVCKHRLRYIKNIIFVYKDEYDENKDYRVINHHMKGVPKSEDWKKKARLNNKRRNPVSKYDINGNFICSYISQRDAERDNGFKKEFLRCRFNRPINGFIYIKETKI